MVDASIRTFGPPEELKHKYGGGLVVGLTVSRDFEAETDHDVREKATNLALSIHPACKCIYSDFRRANARYKYSIPTEVVQWSHMFNVLIASDEVLDFSLCQNLLKMFSYNLLSSNTAVDHDSVF
mmetsp:Transcript_22591/g.27641  ORF Transcript_22591/g.27641 Transcript_22591/m.27641 type:complete len:125 (+) Transcript_22591:253-627(+)